MAEPTPLNLTESTVGGEIGTWGPDILANWAAIQTYSQQETAARLVLAANVPTIAEMTAAINAAIAAAFQAF